jgi:uncharacterized protein YdhG (YjbR/CyaY superfamily)
MAATTSARKTTRGSSAFTAEEQEAMKERAREIKAEKRRGGRSSKAGGESEVLAKLAEMPDADRKLGERIHAIVTKTAPELEPRTWYGMPAYAKDGKVVCFFQGAAKFKARYSTLGFNDAAQLDDGAMWPTSFALTKLTSAEEKRIAELVERAV